LPNEGKDWFIENLGGTWVQTSYNSNFRNKFASIGDYYDPDLDVFLEPKPYASWTLNSETLQWVAPVAKPDTGDYLWDEASVNWVAVEGE
jgi:hypothetical protein